MPLPELITDQWCEIEAMVLAQRFRNGESVAEVCAILGICKQSFYKAVGRSPAFKEAYQKGKDLSEAWWTKLGRGGAAGKVGIQPTTWIFNMKNRFNWKDKLETEHLGEIKINIDGDDEDL